jgi:hypothetical protein
MCKPEGLYFALSEKKTIKLKYYFSVPMIVHRGVKTKPGSQLEAI